MEFVANSVHLVEQFHIANTGWAWRARESGAMEYCQLIPNFTYLQLNNH